MKTTVVENRKSVFKKFNILGVGVSVINMPIALEVIEGWISRRESNYITVADVNSIMVGQIDPEFIHIHNKAGMVTPDGMPLVWLGRLGGHKQMTRVCGPDLMLEVFKRSATNGYRHYFYGGNEGVPELLKKKLEEKYSETKVVGTYSPPFRALTAEEDENIIKTINAAKPDIVWVGIGAPKQERWMAAHVNQLEAPVLIGVGAAFDFNSNSKKRAPLWMQKRGLEWLFRLLTEPRRLWKRYLKNNPVFMFLAIRQALGLKSYPQEWQ